MKNDKGPCKDKGCQHGDMKHSKYDGKCFVSGCPCAKYKN